MRLFARTLIGLAIGADSAIATAYIDAEYAPKNRRGSLAMLQQWTITVVGLSWNHPDPAANSALRHQAGTGNRFMLP